MNQKPILINFVQDEKFIDSVIDCHDTVSTDMTHYYVYVSDNKEYRFKLIKKFNRVDIVKKEQVLGYIKDKNADGILLHCLFSLPLDIINEIPSSVIVLWSSLGYDIYTNPPQNPLLSINLYRPKTNEYQNSLLTPLVRIKGKIKYFIKHYLLNRPTFEYQYYRAISRIDYFSGVLPTEYALIPKKNGFRAKQFQYSYTNFKQLENIKNRTLDEELGFNIMLGNNTNYENNHLDGIEIVSSLDLYNRKVYSPLSYPKNDEYVNKIIETATLAMPPKVFQPLLGFMPLDEYYKILYSCGFFISLAERNQGMAAIFESLRIGCKIFLSKSSVMYKYLKQIGLIVFSIQDDLNQRSISTLLSQEDAQHNLNIMKELYNWDTERKKLQNIKILLVS